MTMKFYFSSIFMYQAVFFFWCFSTFTTVKIILRSQTLQKQVVGQIWQTDSVVCQSLLHTYPLASPVNNQNWFSCSCHSVSSNSAE